MSEGNGVHVIEPNTPMASPRRAARLTGRDLDIIASVAVYKFLSPAQLEHRHFADIQHRALKNDSRAAQLQSRQRTATNRLTALAKRGYLSRVFAYPTTCRTIAGDPWQSTILRHKI